METFVSGGFLAAFLGALSLYFCGNDINILGFLGFQIWIAGWVDPKTRQTIYDHVDMIV